MPAVHTNTLDLFVYYCKHRTVSPRKTFTKVCATILSTVVVFLSHQLLFFRFGLLALGTLLRGSCREKSLKIVKCSTTHTGVDLSKILGGETKIWEQKVAITDEHMNISQLLGARARAASTQSLRL